MALPPGFPADPIGAAHPDEDKHKAPSSTPPHPLSLQDGLRLLLHSVVNIHLGLPLGSSQTPIGRRTHKSATNTSDQMVSALVARRSKRPAYPLNTPCVFRATPKRGITTIGQRPQATENVAQPRQRGCFQKRRAMTNKPKHMAFTITTRKTV